MTVSAPSQTTQPADKSLAENALADFLAEAECQESRIDEF